MLRPLTLLLFTAGLLLADPRPTRAETLLFACSENCPISLFEALELELKGHDTPLVARLSPAGSSVAAHEADARLMASLVPAAAVLWIEREALLRVRVFSPRAGEVREAPLPAPIEQIDARSFAAIAGNVVLQVMNAPTLANEPELAQVKLATSGPMTPISERESDSWPKAKPEKQRAPRFFLRAGAALGLAYLTSGMRVDRAPSQELVNNALAQQQLQNTAEAGKEYLANNGYDCDWGTKSGTSQIIVQNCNAVVERKGLKFAPGIEIQAGGYVTERVALAGLLRVAPDAGKGALNHTLFGIQAEYALIAPTSRGLWFNGGLGLAYGRIQISARDNPASRLYVTSGPVEAHALLAFGYRFAKHFGVYATATVRYLFPDTMWMLEPTVGVEGRL